MVADVVDVVGGIARRRWVAINTEDLDGCRSQSCCPRNALRVVLSQGAET